MVMFHCYVSLPEGMSENRGPQNLTDLDGLSASAPVEGLFFFCTYAVARSMHKMMAYPLVN